MSETQARTHTHLFTLRVWVEDVGNDRFELRGQIKHVLTGETTYFRGMPALQKFLKQWFVKGDTVTKPPSV